MSRLGWVAIALGWVACQGTIGGLVPGDGDDPPEARGPRHARRLSAPQLRQALIGATGFDYLGTARVADPSSPQGSVVRDDAPLLEVYAASLGAPDYDYTTQPSLDASITFAKLAEDGVRHVCGRAAQAEVIDGAHPSGRPHLLVAAGPELVLPDDEPELRANLAALALRFHGQEVRADDEDLAALSVVFAAGYDAPRVEPGPDEPPAVSPPSELRLRNAAGWRAVCIAMLGDPRFLTY